jgi:hypothetical protein
VCRRSHPCGIFFRWLISPVLWIHQNKFSSCNTKSETLQFLEKLERKVLIYCWVCPLCTYLSLQNFLIRKGRERFIFWFIPCYLANLLRRKAKVLEDVITKQTPRNGSYETVSTNQKLWKLKSFLQFCFSFLIYLLNSFFFLQDDERL